MDERVQAAGSDESFVPESWVAGARVRTARALLKTTIILSALLAAVGVLFGEWLYAAISVCAFAIYSILYARLPRWGGLFVAYIFTVTFNVTTLLYMARGRGIFSVTIVLIPAGMFLGAILLKRNHVQLLFAILVLSVAGIGAWKIVGPGSPQVLLPPHPPEILIVSLMLIVASILAWIIVEALRELFVERTRAEESARAARDEVAARNESLQLISDLTHRLQRSLDVQNIAREAIDVLQRLSKPPVVAVYLLDRDGSALELLAQEGFGFETRRGQRLPLVGSLSGAALQQETILTTFDLAADDRLEPATRDRLVADGLRSGAVIPLIAGRALGTLNLLYREERAFTALELDTFEAVGHAVAQAITNALHLANLEHQAFHDALTGLPNRASLFASFDAALVTGAGGGKIAVGALDIHRFRDVSDTLGHRLGDELLRTFASRLSGLAAARESRVFRVGASDFAVLIEAPVSIDDAARRLHALVMGLRDPIEVGGIEVSVGSYCGFAVAPDDAVSGEEILRRAHVALRAAKSSATAVLRYGSGIDQRAPEQLALMTDLTRALRGDEIALHFQPIVELASGTIAGVEALVRWQHPRLGLLRPMAFLPLAEESDVINELTDLVVARALAQLRVWHQRQPRLQMSLNLSARTLLDHNSSQRLLEIIRSEGIAPSQVTFELTETAVMTDRDLALTMLSRITETGAHLSIDDFGTGYSSLTYLRHFPVSEIKIDRSFVADLSDLGQSYAITRSTIELANCLGLSVVAEGIEDAATAESLREIGCRYGQGYFFARPGPAAEIGLQLG